MNLIVLDQTTPLFSYKTICWRKKRMKNASKYLQNFIYFRWQWSSFVNAYEFCVGDYQWPSLYTDQEHYPRIILRDRHHWRTTSQQKLINRLFNYLCIENPCFDLCLSSLWTCMIFNCTFVLRYWPFEFILAILNCFQLIVIKKLCHS